jgi:hypothetical protein
MDYENIKQSVAQEIGIAYPKYEQFKTLHKAITEKLASSRSQIGSNLVLYRQQFSDATTQAEQKNKELLTAQMAGDAESVERIGAELSDINSVIHGTEAKINGIPLIDANDFVLDDFKA